MTADIINLNKARKAKARADKSAQAAMNRVSHGQSKAERSRLEAAEAQRQRALDGAQRCRDGEPKPPSGTHDDPDLDPGTVS